MSRPVARRILGLIAIYALVLQSLLAGVAMSVAASGVVVCMSEAGDPALPDHGSTCLSCATCSHAANGPPRTSVEIARPFESVESTLPLFAQVQPARWHQSQTARAPPAG